MSSKFKPSVAGKASIPYCLPGPLVPVPYVQLPLGTLPPIAPGWLVAYCHWYDSDLAIQPFMSASLQLPLIGPGPKYKGTTFPPYPFLGVTVWFDSVPCNWNVTLARVQSVDVFEHHTWNIVPSQPNGWLKLLPDPLITIPDYDEQQVAVYG